MYVPSSTRFRLIERHTMLGSSCKDGASLRGRSPKTNHLPKENGSRRASSQEAREPQPNLLPMPLICIG